MNRGSLRQALLVGAILALVVVVAGGVYLGTPHHGSDGSVASVKSNPNVAVSEHSGTYVLAPAAGNATTGLVFYPGGRVHPDAYLATLAPLAERAGVRVVVPGMPLNLAVLDSGAAGQYVTNESVDRWYVGGHSLGGAMACRYAADNPNAVDGVVLYAAYCDRDISDTELTALSVTGSADTVLDRETYESNREHLPENATVRELPLNHSQFGSYRGQRGDSPSNVSYAAVHDRLANVTVSWLRARSGQG